MARTWGQWFRDAGNTVAKPFVVSYQVARNVVDPGYVPNNTPATRKEGESREEHQNRLKARREELKEEGATFESVRKGANTVVNAYVDSAIWVRDVGKGAGELFTSYYSEKARLDAQANAETVRQAAQVVADPNASPDAKAKASDTIVGCLKTQCTSRLERLNQKLKDELGDKRDLDENAQKRVDTLRSQIAQTQSTLDAVNKIKPGTILSSEPVRDANGVVVAAETHVGQVITGKDGKPIPETQLHMITLMASNMGYQNAQKDIAQASDNGNLAAKAIERGMVLTAAAVAGAVSGGLGAGLIGGAVAGGTGALAFHTGATLAFDAAGIERAEGLNTSVINIAKSVAKGEPPSIKDLADMGCEFIPVPAGGSFGKGVFKEAANLGKEVVIGAVGDIAKDKIKDWMIGSNDDGKRDDPERDEKYEANLAAAKAKHPDFDKKVDGMVKNLTDAATVREPDPNDPKKQITRPLNADERGKMEEEIRERIKTQVAEGKADEVVKTADGIQADVNRAASIGVDRHVSERYAKIMNAQPAAQKQAVEEATMKFAAAGLAQAKRQAAVDHPGKPFDEAKAREHFLKVARNLVVADGPHKAVQRMDLTTEDLKKQATQPVVKPTPQVTPPTPKEPTREEKIAANNAKVPRQMEMLDNVTVNTSNMDDVRAFATQLAGKVQGYNANYVTTKKELEEKMLSSPETVVHYKDTQALMAFMKSDKGKEVMAALKKGTEDDRRMYNDIMANLNGVFHPEHGKMAQATKPPGPGQDTFGPWDEYTKSKGEINAFLDSNQPVPLQPEPEIPLTPAQRDELAVLEFRIQQAELAANPPIPHELPEELQATLAAMPGEQRRSVEAALRTERLRDPEGFDMKMAEFNHTPNDDTNPALQAAKKKNGELVIEARQNIGIAEARVASQPEPEVPLTAAQKNELEIAELRVQLAEKKANPPIDHALPAELQDTLNAMEPDKRRATELALRTERLQNPAAFDLKVAEYNHTPNNDTNPALQTAKKNSAQLLEDSTKKLTDIEAGKKPGQVAGHGAGHGAGPGHGTGQGTGQVIQLRPQDLVVLLQALQVHTASMQRPPGMTFQPGMAAPGLPAMPLMPPVGALTPQLPGMQMPPMHMAQGPAGLTLPGMQGPAGLTLPGQMQMPTYVAHGQPGLPPLPGGLTLPGTQIPPMQLPVGQMTMPGMQQGGVPSVAQTCEKMKKALTLLEGGTRPLVSDIRGFQKEMLSQLRNVDKLVEQAQKTGDKATLIQLQDFMDTAKELGGQLKKYSRSTSLGQLCKAIEKRCDKIEDALDRAQVVTADIKPGQLDAAHVQPAVVAQSTDIAKLAEALKDPKVLKALQQAAEGLRGGNSAYTVAAVGTMPAGRQSVGTGQQEEHGAGLC